MAQAQRSCRELVALIGVLLGFKLLVPSPYGVVWESARVDNESGLLCAISQLIGRYGCHSSRRFNVASSPSRYLMSGDIRCFTSRLRVAVKFH